MNLIIIFTILVLVSVFVVIIFGRLHFHKVPYSEVINESRVLHFLFPEDIGYNQKQFVILLNELSANLKLKYKANISFEFIAGEYGRHFLVVVDRENLDLVRNIIQKNFPELVIDLVSDYVGFNSSKVISFIELDLTEHFAFPIKTYDMFDLDPQLKLFESLSAMESNQELWLQLVIRPISEEWKYDAKEYVQKNHISNQATPKIERKLKNNGFQFALRLITKSTNRNYARLILQNLQNNFLIFTEATLNTIATKPKEEDAWQRLRKIILGKSLDEKFNLLDKYKARLLDASSENVVGAEELAAIFHFPTNRMDGLPIKPKISTQITAPIATEVMVVADKHSEIVPLETEIIPETYEIKPTMMGEDPLAEAKSTPKPITADEFEKMGT